MKACGCSRTTPRAEQSFIRVRWPHGPQCPNCEAGFHRIQSGANHKTMPFRCRACGKPFSVHSGIVVQYPGRPRALSRATERARLRCHQARRRQQCDRVDPANCPGPPRSIPARNSSSAAAPRPTARGTRSSPDRGPQRSCPDRAAAPRVGKNRAPSVESPGPTFPADERDRRRRPPMPSGPSARKPAPTACVSS